MYLEFIVIYICLGVIIALGIAILAMLIKINNSNDSFPVQTHNKFIKKNSQKVPNDSQDSNLAFCKKCATQFNASERFCPKCGTPR